jgi:hypothetical protein
VPAPSQARTVFASSNTGIMGSNPNRDIDVCVRVFCVCVVLCAGSGLLGCETSRLPHFLDSRLTNDREVVSLTRRHSFTPRKIPGTHFC